MMVDPAITIDLLALILGALTALAGLIYWSYKKATVVVTEENLEEEFTDELEPVESMASEARKIAEQNNRELRELKDLIQGGDSRFDQGLMDYLDENIQKTEQVKEDLDKISQEIDRLQRERDSAERDD